jgi:hypothetical protein
MVVLLLQKNYVRLLHDWTVKCGCAVMSLSSLSWSAIGFVVVGYAMTCSNLIGLFRVFMNLVFAKNFFLPERLKTPYTPLDVPSGSSGAYMCKQILSLCHSLPQLENQSGSQKIENLLEDFACVISRCQHSKTWSAGKIMLLYDIHHGM